MLPLFDRNQIREIDKSTISGGTTSHELIFRASTSFIHWLIQEQNLSSEVHIICGSGNNGADGYLVAEMLANRGYNVMVISYKKSGKKSPENSIYLSRILGKNEIIHRYLEDMPNLDLLNGAADLIDAIIGNGIDRPIEGMLLALAQHVNTHYSRIFGLDSPTGLLCLPQVTKYGFKCLATHAFEFPKLEFFAPENQSFVGHWSFSSIGLDWQTQDLQKTNRNLLTHDGIKSLLMTRAPFAHKGLMGRALFIWNRIMPGAGIMMLKASVASGTGLTYSYMLNASSDNSVVMPPESISVHDLNDSLISQMDCLAIGPGFGNSQEAADILEVILKTCKKPIVLDADALNIIAEKKWQGRMSNQSILTPHIKEFERLFGETSSHFERIQCQIDQSIKLQVIIVLKGRYTSVSTPDGRLYYNSTGNPSLAKGGSGDILTGMIASLLAQGYVSTNAALTAVYLHGLCADLYVEENHEMTMSPLDILTYLSSALNRLKSA